MIITLLTSILNSSAAELIQIGGLALILTMVFVETGLLIGVFVPGGGSILFSAGLLAGSSILPTPIYFLIPLVIITCTLGDITGYTLGYTLGPSLEKRGDTWFFKTEHLNKARQFYNQHGFFAIVLGRFLPFIRTFNPLVAGITRMNPLHYLVLCISGTTIWVVSIMGCSYIIGQQFPALKKHVGYFVAAVFIVSVLPALLKYLFIKPGKSQVG